MFPLWFFLFHIEGAKIQVLLWLTGFDWENIVSGEMNKKRMCRLNRWLFCMPDSVSDNRGQSMNMNFDSCLLWLGTLVLAPKSWPAAAVLQMVVIKKKFIVSSSMLCLFADTIGLITYLELLFRY